MFRRSEIRTRFAPCTRLPVLAALGLFAFVACDSADPSNTDLDADAADVGDVPSELGDADAATDEISADANPDTAPDDDNGARPDGGDTSDVDTDSPDGDVPAAIGEPCREDADCVDEICIDIVAAGDDDSFCSRRCVDESGCPELFDCVLLSDGTDGESVCVPVELCIDRDGDLFGVGPGCLGLDCDDDNDSVNPRADEPCDGIDNDCDTIIDDNPIDDLAECGTGLPGQCASGRFACGDGGLLSCVADAAPEAERCDGVDNNCDGDVDEDELGAPLSRSCFDGDPAQQGEGLCRAGVRVCEEGEFGSCLGQVLPGIEVCDGLDNDCDGEIDEGLAVITYFRDNDGDRFGDSTASVDSCVPPADYVTRGGDCNDDNDAVFPGATEVPGDGTDSNCDGLELCRVDFDGDLYVTAELVLDEDLDCDSDGLTATGLPGDCDDEAESVYPGAVESPGDGMDQNCDGLELCFADLDDDGFRTDEVLASDDILCGRFGLATVLDPAADCDDLSRTTYPGAPELCDDVNNDCDEEIDEDAGIFPFWPDLDDDGFGDASAEFVEACTAPARHVANRRDCDDANINISPAAAELIADGVDNNCDGSELCYADFDDDGFRPPTGATVLSADLLCDGVGEARADDPPTDCDDLQALVNPAQGEAPADGIDQNCDGREFCYVDVDGDDYRAPGGPIATTDLACSGAGLADASSLPGDCNDDDAAIKPDSAELPGDGRDENCDGIELCYEDADDDGYLPADATILESDDIACADRGLARNSAPGGDCNDGNPAVRPGAEELCDGVDNNCDGDVDGLDESVADSDNDGVNACDDCDDSDPSIPAGPPVVVSELTNVCVPRTCSGDGTDDPTVRTLVVPSGGVVGDIRVAVDIQHPYVSDLRIELVSPAGTRVLLVNHRGGSGDNFSGTIFDDAAAASITSAAAPFRGSYRPEQALAAFDGEPAAGGWRLEVFDDYAIQNGALRGWSVTIDAACP